MTIKKLKSNPEPMDYRDLIYEIEKGTMKIPDFQRNIVWKIDQTIDLLDSIAKGFPIGTFIFWETNEYMKTHREIGNLALNDVPEGYMVKYVLDGQQRITSLYASLKKARINNKTYSVYCDLDAQYDEPIFSNKDEEPLDPFRFINIADLLSENPQKIYNKLSEERQIQFDSIRDAFRYYKFSTIDINECPLDMACEIFERINTTGTVLDIFDIMVAKTWTREFDLREKYNEFVQTLQKKGYDGIGSSAILQSISAISKKKVHRRDILSISRDEMNENWDQYIKAISHAIDFIRNDIGIKVWKLLPYPVIIAPLSYFYFQNNFNNPNFEQSEHLKKFFWGTCVSRAYSFGPDTRIRNDIKVMDKILYNEKPSFEFPVVLDKEILINTKLSLGDAFCKSVLCYLASKRPRKFENNNVINLENNNLTRANSKHYHHFFPKNYLKKRGISELADSIVNICLIPADSNLRISNKRPKDYLEEIEDCKKPKICNKKLRETLESHLICDFEDFGIDDDDYNKFLNERAQLIVEGLKRLIGNEKTVLIPEDVEIENIIKTDNEIETTDEPGTYDLEELKLILQRYLSEKRKTPQRIKRILLPLCLENQVVTREMIKTELIKRENVSDEGKAGIILTSISGEIGRDGRDYLRQIIEYERPNPWEKENYKLKEEYKELIKELLSNSEL